MLIKKFVAPSLPEALSKVKDDFGEDAVILKTRFNNKGNGLGNEGRFVEVTAAIDKSETTAEVKKPVNTAVIPPANNRLKAAAPIQAVPKQPAPQSSIVSKQIPESSIKSPSEILSEMRKDILAIRADIAGNRKESLFGQPLGLQLEIGRILLAKHLPEYMVIDLLKQLPPVNESEPDKTWHAMLGLLADLLGKPEPIKIVDTGATVVMLVGPTGGGKSSSAARLAFRFTMEEKAGVSLVTTDNFRADSREQLMSLANVIGCSFTAVTSPEELTVYLKTIKSGLVLIDTSGISSKADIDELSVLVGAANPHEIHLVIPADTPAGDITDFIDNNPSIEIDRLFVTKLDQSGYRGGVIGGAFKSNLTFSYQSSFRELPGDIDLFNPSTFVSALKPRTKTNRVDQAVLAEVNA